jgi:predicted nucleic acid-binding protein
MNLLATGKCEAITRGSRLLIAPAVLTEAIYIYADASRNERTLINEELLRTERVEFVTLELSDEEITLAVRYAERVDDGEAQTLAVAYHRGISVLTDDVAGLRLAATLGLGVATTLDLIRKWSELDGAPDAAAALRAMRLRANYAVPKSHPLASWYSAQLQEPSGNL